MQDPLKELPKIIACQSLKILWESYKAPYQDLGNYNYTNVFFLFPVFVWLHFICIFQKLSKYEIVASHNQKIVTISKLINCLLQHVAMQRTKIGTNSDTNVSEIAFMYKISLAKLM